MLYLNTVAGNKLKLQILPHISLFQMKFLTSSLTVSFSVLSSVIKGSGDVCSWINVS